MPLPPLSPEQLVKPRYFEARIALIFASLFVSTGINLPYFPLWLEANGFDAERIAVILAAPMFLRVVTTPFVTAYADRASDRANVLLVLVVAALLISCGFFLPPVYGMVLLVSLALSVVWTPQGPLVDLLALSGVRRFGAELHRHAHLGIDLVSRRQSHGRHHPVVDQPASRAGDHHRQPRRRVADGDDRPAHGQAAARLAAFGRGIAGSAQTAQPLLPAVRDRRRHHQRQSRLHVRFCVDLLEITRPRRHADGLPVGVCRRLGSLRLHGFHAVFRPVSGDHLADDLRRCRDRALDRLSAGLAARPRRSRISSACRACMGCRPVSC